MNKAQSVHIVQLRQNHPHDAGEQLRQLCQAKAPILAWAEPLICLQRNAEGKPQSGRHRGFQSLVAGYPNWLEQGIALAEVRLFWPDKAVHLLANGKQGCISVTLSESNDSEPNALKQQIYLLTLRDTARFGLEEIEDAHLSILNAVEYRKNGRLLAWRLIENTQPCGEKHHG